MSDPETTAPRAGRAPCPGRHATLTLALALALAAPGRLAAEEPPKDGLGLAPPATAAPAPSGGLTDAPLDPARAGRIPGRVEPRPTGLFLGTTLELLGTGGEGPTIPYPYIGGG